MSTMTRPPARARVRPGQLLGARQLAEVVRRLAASPADWLGRVRLNPAGRWYERIHLDDSHEVWVISWLPGQATGFHDHGGSAGAFAVGWGTLMERRGVGAITTGQGLGKPVGAGGAPARRPPPIPHGRPPPPPRGRGGGDGGLARVRAAAAADAALRPDAGRGGQGGPRRRSRVVTVRPRGARPIDEILVAARARLRRLTRSRPSARRPSAACSL